MKLDDLKVVQANSLIQQMNWNMSNVQLKLFKAAVAAIDTNNPPDNGIVTVSKSELLKLLDGDQKHLNYLRDRLRSLQRADYKLYENEKEEVYITLVNKIWWYKQNDEVRIRFDEEVIPYLIVSSRFLQYSAADLKQFKSKYGLVLYEQLLSRQRQSGEMVITLTVEYLKWVTGTSDQYNQFGNWERRVLQAGINDLNSAGVSFLAKYTKNKKGHSIHSIKFVCVERQSWSDTTYEEAWAAKVMKEAQRRNPDLVIDQSTQQPDPPDQQLSLFDVDPTIEAPDNDILNDKRELTPEDMPF